MNKSIIPIVGIAAVLAIFATSAIKADGYSPKAVVELFTSQGCSSCPPADKILADYAKGHDVLALAWHVDYWNYLGWKDTFSSSQFTDRQKRYAKSLRERQIYTPQAIVNGRSHTVGSRRGKIEDLIKNYVQTSNGLTVPIKVKVTGEQMQIRVNHPSATKNHPTLYMVYFNSAKEVVIKRGENRGKTFTYRNIVQKIQMLGMLKAGAISVDLPLMEVKRAGFDSCAILLQETTASGTPGAIVGASVVEDFDT